MAAGAEQFHHFHDLPTFRGSDEMQFTSMLATIAHWRQRHCEDFVIVHDASSNFMRQRSMWDTITASEVPTQTHTLGDGSSLQFPLRIRETKAVDSRKNRSVQLCDLIAGFAAKCFDEGVIGEQRQLILSAIDAGLSELTFNGTRPGSEFPEASPNQADGPDAVDRMMHIMFASEKS